MKIDDQLRKRMQKLRDKKSDLILKIGLSKIEKEQLKEDIEDINNELEQLLHSFQQTREEEIGIQKEIQQKYGDVVVNIDTGEVIEDE